MRPFRLSFIALVFTTSLLPPARAQDTTGVRFDSSEVTVRTVPEEALAAFRNNPDFDYEDAPGQARPWWLQVWDWFVANVLEPIFGQVPFVVYKWLFYLVIAVTIFYAITRLLQLSPRNLFRANRKKEGLTFEDIEGDIQAIDFDQRIAEAEAENDYRRAVRLWYLKVLQQLADQGGIRWQRDKTNHEYLAELTPPSLRPAFSRLTYLFEYIWYGDLPLDAPRYDRAKDAFRVFEESRTKAQAVEVEG